MASSKLDSTKVMEALSYLKSKSFQDGNSQVMIIHNGRVVYEGDSTYKRHNIYSCSKGFTSTVLGLLIDDKRIKLDDYAAKYVSDLIQYYPTVSFRHFATMTSGYSAAGRSRWNDENADWSYKPYIPEKPHFAPGTQYEYWDEAQMMYGRTLTKILGKTMEQYLKEKITNQIGLGEWTWDTEGTVNGIPINNGCTGVTMNAQQLAKWGLLFLNNGNWNGKQVISKKWCQMATTNQVGAAVPIFQGDRAVTQGSGSYGFNWWVNSRNGLSRLPDAPVNVAYLSGLNHNVCCIIPEWNMVIVRMGTDKNPSEPKHLVWNMFLKKMGEAITR
jgi:CubicO group peptidase (beta-lactamase class C family)